MNCFKFFNYTSRAGNKLQIVITIKDGNLFFMAREKHVSQDKLSQVVSNINYTIMLKYHNMTHQLDSDFPTHAKLFVGYAFAKEITKSEMHDVFIPIAKTGIQYLTESNT